MARIKKLENPVQIPVKIEKTLKDALADHCEETGVMFTWLVRRILTEYAEKEGLIK